jgi:hypothetical protein
MSMQRVAVAAFVVAISLAGARVAATSHAGQFHYSAAPTCGVERWKVKTLQDRPRLLRAHSIPIAQLVSHERQRQCQRRGVNREGTGTATYLGKYMEHATFQIDVRRGSATGTATFTAANGDTLTASVVCLIARAISWSRELQRTASLRRWNTARPRFDVACKPDWPRTEACNRSREV